MGGEERPPGPRLLRGDLNEADDTDEEWTAEESEAATETQSKIVESGDTTKGLSQEGVYSGGMHGSCH